MNPTSTESEGVITRYVRALAADRADAAEAVPEVVAELKKMVRAALRRSGRWLSSPRHLGYDGPNWSGVFAGDQMPDVVVDYCVHLFGSRLHYLIELANGGGTVEPFCGGTAVNQFLHDRHSGADECGYAVYQNTRGSIGALVAARVLTAEADPIEGGTPVRFSGASAPASARKVGDAVTGDLEAWVPVLRVLGRIARAAQEALADRLCTFADRGLTALNVNNTATGLAPPVREHAPPSPSDGFTDLEGDGGGLDQLAGADPGADPEEGREQLLLRLEQIRDAISHYRNGTRPTRDGMRRLVAELIRLAEAGEEFVQAEAAARFGVAESTLNDHMRHLRQLAGSLAREGRGAAEPRRA